ncbi:MAG: lipopolysaccharide biosynthesis protein, partial [Pseudomonadales bacterium]|nr:lipopolysaccharide biosynthesis protein [Pseudomonadales bacterium]
ESESKGERFTLIEPPLMPEKPVKPNRRLIAVAGFVVALMAFSAVVFLLEKLDQTFRSPGSLSRFMGAPALVVIPHISTSEEIQTKKRYALIAGVGCVVCAIAFAVLIHVVWMPLDILWYVALRKVG